MTKKIENFPIDKSELLVQIINRINSDFQENIVIDVRFPYFDLTVLI